jgi:hypothetical protein
MSKPLFALCFLGLAGSANAAEKAAAPPAEKLQYHNIRVDAQGMLLPWQFDDPARAFDSAIRMTWNFWDNMAADRNGLPYHMNHQVWRPQLDDHRGIGGDQIPMALSSWTLLYQYLGNETNDPGGNNAYYGRIVENMRFMADWYLSHGLSRATDKWPNVPYPYNTMVYSGIYDGDMILGLNYTQPDKAGSLAWELLALHKITGNPRYMDAAIAIANSLAAKTTSGDNDNSPMPFKVNAVTGEVGKLFNKGKDGKVIEARSSYTSNWSGTLNLFLELQRLKKGNTKAYKLAFDKILAWMKAYPLKTNKWGPFFEDIDGWSDTQINAVTFSDFIMDHQDLFPTWRNDVQGIFNWTHDRLGNPEWQKYGVIAINEQTAYKVPGNSHSSRQAASELRFAELTGDASHNAENIRRLSWATYMIDTDGRNRYLRDDVWMTDGYGDFVRHYLRAMAATPQLVPADQNHILRSSGLVIRAKYEAKKIVYRTFEAPSTELIHLARKPKSVALGEGRDVPLYEKTDLSGSDGWSWQPLSKSGSNGVVRIRHDEKVNVTVELN